MKRSKTAVLLTLLLALALLVQLAPAAFARVEAKPVIRKTVTHVNPEYAGLITEADLVRPQDAPADRAVSVYYDNLVDAAADLRAQLNRHTETVSIGLVRTAYDDVPYALDLMDLAMAHSGAPTEGDYVSHQYGGWSADYTISYADDGFLIEIVYTMTWFTTQAQEAAVDAAAASLLASLNLDGKSDYEKLQAIYGWMCSNITYDYDRIEQNISHTAYAALIDRTAVCQGYSTLLYRLLLAEGIDCRYVSGYAEGGRHGWNIVRLNDRYYNVDVTWDAGCYQGSSSTYFLRCNANFPDHSRDPEFGAAFDSCYPMSAADYPAGSTAGALITAGPCGEALRWAYAGGVLTVSGSGEMYDFGLDAPWRALRGEIRELRVGEGVTSLGACAFYGCTALTKAALPEGLASVGAEAFHGCAALQELGLPVSVASIGDGAFCGCAALATVSVRNADCALFENVCTLGVAGSTVILGHEGSTAEAYASRFGYSFRKIDCAGAHSYVACVTAATCTEGGYTTYICSVCGDSYVADETAPLGHHYENGVCTLCGKADPDYEPPITFSDVAAGAYYAVPVDWAVANGVTTGTGGGRFSPDATCTRGQVVTFLWRAKGSPEPSSTDNPFVDVKTTDYFYKAVLWAKETGVTSGTSATTFSPGNGCTRAQVVTFLWRTEGKPAPASANNPFGDVKAGEYYTDAVLWAVSRGITQGTSATTFSPDKTCTRGQIVTFLYRDLA